MCDKQFPNARSLFLHRRFVHVQGQFGCGQANCHFDTASNRALVAAHIRLVHPELLRVTCEECGFRSDSREAHSIHSRSHYLDDRPYWCKFDRCNFNSSQRSLIMKHIRRYHLELNDQGLAADGTKPEINWSDYIEDRSFKLC